MDPIDSLHQQEVCRHVGNWLEKGRQLFAISTPEPEILFDLKGRTAGQFSIRKGQPRIRFNPYLFSKYYSENLSTTVPHEVAHMIVYYRYGRLGIKPHGREWRDVMSEFAVDANVTADFDITGIPVKKVTRHPYICQCRKHWLTSYRHNKILANQASYKCRACNSILRPYQ